MMQRTVLTMSKPTVGDIGIKRTDYKAIKKMDRIQLSDYLNRIWKRGFEKGYQTATQPKKLSSADNDTAQSAMTPTT